MKKLLILLAFIMLIYYAKASAASKEWVDCANKAVAEEQARSEINNPAFVKDLCAFYEKPIPECIQILDNASPREQVQIFQDYLTHVIVLPKCGTPK